jgi:erythritol transport system substrate-binding protein
MFSTTKVLAITALVLSASVFATNASAAGGLISIIVNDPANPYWLTEGNVAAAQAKKLGYTANIGAHKADTNTESNLIDTAITNKSVAIILDPANASGSIGAVKKAIAANIPVFLVNAEIEQCARSSSWCTGMGQGRRREGQVCRTSGRAFRQQCGHPFERLHDRAQPVS